MLAGMDFNDFSQMAPHGSVSHFAPLKPARGRSVWAIIGIVLAVVLVIGGLAFIGVMVLLFVGLSHYGSNK
jgi:hypothetical protein